MTIPPEVQDLIDRFARSRDAYRSAAYNEAQARREFIDPFFQALGWDVDNKSGLAEAYKDVIHEDAIKIGGATKAPDYCFRIGGTRKSFVQTKKPAAGGGRRRLGHRRSLLAQTAHEPTLLRRQIDATDRQINQLVYQLYRLTDDEIKIVEETTQR